VQMVRPMFQSIVIELVGIMPIQSASQAMEGCGACIVEQQDPPAAVERL